MCVNVEMFIIVNIIKIYRWGEFGGPSKEIWSDMVFTGLSKLMRRMHLMYISKVNI